jgi:hypothetical protein
MTNLKKILGVGIISLIATSCLENQRIHKERRQVREYKNLEDINSPRRLITLQDTYLDNYEGEKLLERYFIKTDTIKIDSIIGYQNFK